MSWGGFKGACTRRLLREGRLRLADGASLERRGSQWAWFKGTGELVREYESIDRAVSVYIADLAVLATIMRCEDEGGRER